MDSSDQRQQSEFNMAVSYLNRLNSLFYICDEAAMELNVYTWFHSLMAIFRELSTEMKDKEIDTFNGTIDKISPKVTKVVTEQNTKGITQVNSDLYKELHTFELELRKILKTAGLQIKMMDEAGMALK